MEFFELCGFFVSEVGICLQINIFEVLVVCSLEFSLFVVGKKLILCRYGGSYGKEFCFILFFQEERGIFIYYEVFLFSVVFLLGIVCKEQEWIIIQFN